jgi:ferredoxin-type protein NapH
LKSYRRATQLLVLFLVVFTAFFSMYGFLKKEGELEEVESPLLKAGFSAIDVVASRFFDTLNEYLEASLMIHGSTWSFKLKGLVITDPLAAISAVLSGKVIYMSLLAAIAIPVAFTLFFGRGFCGWMCPVNTIFEAFDWMRHRLPGRDVKFDYNTKYYLLGIGLVLSFAGIPVFHWIYPPIILAQEIFSFVFYLSLGFGAALLLGILLFELFVSRRAWCRYFCPGGALFSIIASRGFLRIMAEKGECKPMVEANPHGFKACFECRNSCMLGFDPINKRSRGECNMCGECIAACPRGAVKYSFSLPSWMRRALGGDAG